MVSIHSRSSPDTQPYLKAGVYHILAGRIFDSYTRKLIPDQVITVDRNEGIILEVQDYSTFTSRSTSASEGNAETIDLKHLTILPGFVDSHVHLFLHAYSGTPWNDQVTTESIAERSLRAGVHARQTLMAGFTTVRDLGTEGAANADIALRKCLSTPGYGQEAIILGPRYYCATRAIVSTGSYGPKSTLYPSQNGVDGVTGAEIADGVDECIKAVRRQIGAGADWIKIYGDYTCRSQTSDVSRYIAGQPFATFNDDELRALIDTAHSLGVKVAVHAYTADVIGRLLPLGPDTIEHGGNLFDTSRGGDGADIVRQWAETRNGPTWVPTLAVFHSLSEMNPGDVETWEQAKKSFQTVLEIGGVESAIAGGKGIKICCGGDAGAFAHGDNGLEMVWMRKLGAGWATVLYWATLAGWECVRGSEWEGTRGKERIRAVEDSVGVRGGGGIGKGALERDVPFGAIRNGWAGDLVGIEGVLDGDVEQFEQAIMKGVQFVMKGGTLCKRDGKEVR